MKRNVLLFCTLILFICFLNGCVSSPETDTSDTVAEPITNGSLVRQTDNSEEEESAFAPLQKEIKENGDTVGLAFIGYVNMKSDETDLRTYLADSRTGRKYPFLSNAPLYVTEGQELYAVMPASEKETVTVYFSSMNESCVYFDDKTTPLYRGKPGEALLVRCNFSEIYSNVLLSVTDGEETFDFHPAVSLKDGHLSATEGIYDFSVYEKIPDETSAETAMELLCETDEIREAMERGMKLLYTGDTQMIDGYTCLVFALGTDSEWQFVRERYYGVYDDLIYVYDAVSDTWSAL